ncbi:MULTISPECIES: hypothetical protein [unclassified Streptomyces]|uniref:hypothetical protein n=1 Tax=unclassified Streptomyces TaxID=2593676 RepID=UPI00225129DF|nr:hypothetical protein [Streptomyces sp. NBC_00401]MCX5084121.1 hypothetical protein [Streptomyces sp. NBC_00401]
MKPGQIPGVDGDDHGIESTVGYNIGRPALCVSGDDTDAVMSGGAEEAGGAVGDGGVDVDGGDVPWAYDFGDQSGILRCSLS